MCQIRGVALSSDAGSEVTPSPDAVQSGVIMICWVFSGVLLVIQ